MTGEEQSRVLKVKRVGGGEETSGEKKCFSIRLPTLKAAKWVNYWVNKQTQSLSLCLCFSLSQPYRRWQIWLISVPAFGAVSLMIYVVWHYKIGSRDKQCPCCPPLCTHTHALPGTTEQLKASPLILSGLRLRSFLITLSHKPWIRKTTTTQPHWALKNCHITFHARPSHVNDALSVVSIRACICLCRCACVCPCATTIVWVRK